MKNKDKNNMTNYIQITIKIDKQTNVLFNQIDHFY